MLEVGACLLRIEPLAALLRQGLRHFKVPLRTSAAALQRLLYFLK